MVERETPKKEGKVRIMGRTLFKRLSFSSSISQRIKDQVKLITETGSDWHDIQALHEGIYVDQEVRGLLGLPQGQIEIIQPREETDTVGIGNSVILKDKNGDFLKMTIGGGI